MTNIGLGLGLVGGSQRSRNVVNSISNLMIWMDASTIQQADNTPIESWKGISDRSVTFTQSNAANRPTFVSAGQNGKGTVQFSGNQWVVAGANTLPQASARTYVMVVKDEGRITFTDRYFVSTHPDYAAGAVGVNDVALSKGMIIQDLFSGDTPIIENTELTENEFHIIALAYTQSQKARLYVDGYQVGEVNIGNLGLSGVPLVANSLVLGGLSSAGDVSNTALGEIAEVIVYNKELSTAEYTKIYDYLIAKWDLKISPKGIPNLQTWLDASTILQADNTLVALWEDQSGNNYHASQTDVTMQPIYRTNQQNGRPALIFNELPVVQFLRFTGAGLTMGRNVPCIQAYAVVKYSATTTTRTLIYLATSATNSRFVMNQTSGLKTNTGGRKNLTDAYVQTSGFVETTGDFALHMGTLDYTQGRLYNRYKFQDDPIGFTETNFASGLGNTDNLNSSQIRLGANLTTGALDGSVAEFLLFSRNLDVAEKTRIEAYLKRKWGL